MAIGRDLAEQLLRKAVDDEEATRAMLPLEPVTDAIVGFHAQQAVEKSLKAVLAARDVEFPFVHDGEELTEVQHPATVIPAAEWPTYSSERFPREVAEWQEKLDAEDRTATASDLI